MNADLAGWPGEHHAGFLRRTIAFLLLQAKQQATRFSHVERPRRDRGTT